MIFQGQKLERLSSNSPEFLEYQEIFGGKILVKLYKISYEPIGQYKLNRFRTFPAIYYHGTGHCGCVLKRGAKSNLTDGETMINSNEWCGGPHCATQGILNMGHLLDFSKRGHFFSPDWRTAYGYCKQKSGEQKYHSMFLVKARIAVSKEPICSVLNDADILPCYLAVLRNF
ncbi:hypothetical protein FBU30_008842 [Linnemannia zychae]|nr:hypothetical protein FBU30_008842 [Linnemannia zychae]